LHLAGDSRIARITLAQHSSHLPGQIMKLHSSGTGKK
jgi:hypothetical protein